METKELEAAFKALFHRELERLQSHFPGSHCSIQMDGIVWSSGPIALGIKAYQADLGWTESYKSVADAVDELVRSKSRRAERIREEIARKQAEVERLEAGEAATAH